MMKLRFIDKSMSYVDWVNMSRKRVDKFHYCRHVMWICRGKFNL